MTNTVTMIAQEVSRVTGVSINDILAERRGAGIVFARHMCFVLARDLTRHSLPKIGRAFGRRDHTTVISALRAWPSKAATCETYRSMEADARAAVEARLAPVLKARRAIAEATDTVVAA